MDTLLRRTGIHLPGTLRFVESEDEYSTYRDRDGEEVWLAHGTGKVLVAFDDLDLDALWKAFVADEHNYYSWSAYVDRDTFRDILRAATIEPDYVDDIGFCPDCYEPDHEDDLYCTNGSHDDVCSSCLENYHGCDDCEERFRDTTTTLDEREVCEGCRSRNWTYCEDCDGYRRDEDYDHDHGDDDDDDDGDGCCESPAQSFAIRNDGDDPLWNDTRATVALAAGTISDEGLDAIRNAIQSYSYNLVDPDAAYNLRAFAYGIAEALGNLWQSKEGNYTKRLSRHAYKTAGIKLTPDLMSQIGNIARDHSTAIDFQIEVTRDLNQSARAFAHADSCWWQSYYEGRCTLKSNGGFGLRTFDGDDVTGRAWVMPLRLIPDTKSLTPTFDTETPDAFVVFNGYGTLSGYTAARIMSHMAGMTYRKVSFSCSPMYINSDSGYLIAPEEIAGHYTDGSLSLSVSQHSSLFTNESKVLTNV